MTTEVITLVAGINAKHAEIDAALKSTDKSTAEIKTAIENAIGEIKTLGNRVLEAEQKLAEKVSKGQEHPASLGNAVIQSASVKSFLDGTSMKGRFEAKSPLLTQTGAGASDSTLVPANRLAGIVGGPLRVLSILDVIPTLGTNSNSIEWTKELLFTNNAAMKADGAASATSSITFEQANAPVRQIAHNLVLSKNIMADAPQVEGYINTRLTHGLRLKLEAQIVSGDGTGQNLSGMLDSGNFSAFTPTAAETALDGINRAIEAAELAEYSVDVVIMNPADWYAISRIKTSTGEYLVGNPVGGLISMNVWGKPVVTSAAMPAGSFLVASLAMAYGFFQRDALTVELFTQHAEQATSGLVTLQAAQRGAFAAFRPASARFGLLKA